MPARHVHETWQDLDPDLNPVGRVCWAGAGDLAERVPGKAARIAAAHKGAAAELVRPVQIAAAVVGAGLAVLAWGGGRRAG